MKFIFKLLLLIILTAHINAFAQDTFTNPVLSGFHPDPSICRVGEDYYLANSTFEWFPGVPIYHSRDLVNWELIGHALHRPEQLPQLMKVKTSRGIYAPTLRYHDGLFYMITTCVQGGGNFFVTAENPAGPWSDPVWLPEAPGIDPSLFWDDDGKCYYTGAGRVTQLQDKWENQNGVWIAEIDLKAGKLIGEKIQLTHGHGTQAWWTEGPHIYKIDGRYLLMVAEGGTGFTHAITVFESDDIRGPYIPSQINPVLTHRHLGADHLITTIGHGDLVETQNGEWWAVTLGKRQLKSQYLLARETFLTPVVFENGWPVFNPGKGMVTTVERRPNLPWSPVKKQPVRDNFNDSKLGLDYYFLRTPLNSWFEVGNGKLEVELRPEQLTEELVNPSMIMKKLTAEDFEVATALKFNSKRANEEAGLTLFRDAYCHYTLALSGREVVLKHLRKGELVKEIRQPYKNSNIVLKASATDGLVSFYYGATVDNLTLLADKMPLTTLADQVSGGFNGPFLGMYASSNGKISKNKAIFNWFEYKVSENAL